MKLVIFDIDGTLANTTGIDDHCFAQAIEDVLSIKLPNTDWSTYPHVTDTGMAYEIFKRHHGYAPPAEKIEEVRVRFVELVKEALMKDPNMFSEVKGARNMFGDLCSRNDLAVGIATGGWRATAAMKLDAINIDHRNVPFFATDDHYCRRNITELVIDETKRRSGRSSFDDIVSVGDGSWDYHTSNELGIRFIGVDAKGNGKLKKLGAKHVIPHFEDINAFYRLLEI
jgi:phosphoglycolate phosphatase-like HAD superfamily hydrolase